SLAQHGARLEIEQIGIDIEVVAPLARAKRQAKGLDDRARGLILDGEDVLELTIELFGPQPNFASNLNQLDGDAQAVARAQDGPLDDQVRSELLTNLAQVTSLAFECER